MKGEPRILITAFVRPGRSTCLVRCVRCLDAGFAKAILRVYGAAERVPVEAGVDSDVVTTVREQLCAHAVRLSQCVRGR